MNSLVLTPGTYSVTVSADTTMADAGETYTNVVTLVVTLGGSNGLPQTITSTSSASVASCIHGSSLIKLADGHETEISKLKAGDQIMSADNTAVVRVKEVVPCWAGVFGQVFLEMCHIRTEQFGCWCAFCQIRHRL